MTLADRLRSIVAPLPPGSAITLPGDVVRGWLDDEPPAPVGPQPVVDSPAGWRERLWTVPADVRLGVREVAEAVDRSPDWVYRASNAKKSREKGREPLPCSRMDGELVFSAGAVRDWVRSSELVVNPPRGTRT